MKAWLVCGLWGLMAMAHAQPSEDVPQVLAKERASLALKRSAILAEFESRSQDCWQRFAVNDCIRQARRLRRADLEPIRRNELQLNEQERQWRSEQRDERLQNKQLESAVKP
jgi:hypothetical protein